MKTLTKSILYPVIVLTVFLASSCSNDKDEEGLTKAEAEQSLAALADILTEDITSIAGAEGAQSLENLMSLVTSDNSKNGRLIKAQLSILDQLKNVAIPFTTLVDATTERFDFTANFGVYNYDLATQSFIKSVDEVSYIEINFPDKNSNTNNANLTLWSYADKQILVGFEPQYVPVLMEVTLNVDEVKMVEFGMDLELNSFGILQSGNAALFVSPFNFSLNSNSSTNNITIFNLNITNGDELILSSKTEVEYTSDQKIIPAKIESNISYGTFSMISTIDLEGITPMSDEIPDLNELIKAALFDGADKIGDILFEEGDNGMEAYLVYQDGSKVALKDILKSIFEK